MEYTHDIYFNLPLTLGICNRQAGTAAWDYVLCYHGQCHPDTNVFRCFEHHFREAGSVTPMSHMNAGPPWMVWTPAN